MKYVHSEVSRPGSAAVGRAGCGFSSGCFNLSTHITQGGARAIQATEEASRTWGQHDGEKMYLPAVCWPRPSPRSTRPARWTAAVWCHPGRAACTRQRGAVVCQARHTTVTAVKGLSFSPAEPGSLCSWLPRAPKCPAIRAAPPAHRNRQFRSASSASGAWRQAPMEGRMGAMVTLSDGLCVCTHCVLLLQRVVLRLQKVQGAQPRRVRFRLLLQLRHTRTPRL